VSPTHPPAVAAFDFDGTLTNGGSVLQFLVALRGHGPVTLAVLRNLAGIVRGGLVGGATADDAKEALFMGTLAGVPVADAERTGAEFAERHLRRRLRHDARERLEWHKKRGDLVVVVSASPEFYVRPAAELLGAHGAIATRLEASGGLLTGRYQGKNCRGAEKYAGITAWIRSQGLGPDQPILWAYGNSRGDRRLLEAADYPVNAGRLGRFGRLGRYPTLSQVLLDASLPGAGSTIHP